MLKIFAQNILKSEEYIEIEFDIITMPGGEPHVKIQDNNCTHVLSYRIEARIQSFNDLGELLVVYDALKRMGKYVNTISIPYFPGARQDRVSNEGEAFTAKVYANILNNLDATIEICDPHSDVTPALLNSCKLYPIEYIIDSVIKDCNPDYIISPDAGASKRIEKYLLKIGCEIPVIQCLKKRDTKTGKLSGFQVCSSEDELKNTSCLIIDDICDGGGTFNGIAAELANHDVDNLFLYITHGIFSKGYTDLLSCYNIIYTTDSFIPKESPSEYVVVKKLYV